MIAKSVTHHPDGDRDVVYVLNLLAKLQAERMKEKGFDGNTDLELHALMFTEISESIEQTRAVLEDQPCPKCDQKYDRNIFGKLVFDQESGMWVCSSHSEHVFAIHPKIESKKIPGFTIHEEEMADLFWRLMHFSGRKELRIGEAIIAKAKYNMSRPYKHGRNM